MASSGPSPSPGGRLCLRCYRDNWIAVRSPGFEPADYVLGCCCCSALSFADRVLLPLQPEILFPQTFQLSLVGWGLLHLLILRHRSRRLLSARAGE